MDRPIEIPLGPNLTEEQARAIYARGEDAVVFALLAQAKLLTEQLAPGVLATTAEHLHGDDPFLDAAFRHQSQ